LRGRVQTGHPKRRSVSKCAVRRKGKRKTEIKEKGMPI